MLEYRNDDDIDDNGKSKSLGICLSFLSAFVWVIQNTILQKMNLHFNDVLLTRALLETVSGLILVKIQGEAIWIKGVDVDKNIYKIRLLVFAYGLFGAFFSATNLIAVYFMPLGDAMTIVMSSILPTMILAAIFLKERLRLYKLFCAVLVLTGLVLVIRPPFLFAKQNQSMNIQSNDNLGVSVSEQSFCVTSSPSPETHASRSKYYYLGVLAGLICMLSSASFRIVAKILVKNKSTSSFGILMFYSSCFDLMLSLILPAFGGEQRILFRSMNIEKYDTGQWIGLFAIALLGITQFSMRFRAIKLISPVMVSFIRTSEIVVAYIIQITFLGTEPYMTSLIGSGFVMIACIGVILESWMIKMSPLKIKWIF